MAEDTQENNANDHNNGNSEVDNEPSSLSAIQNGTVAVPETDDQEGVTMQDGQQQSEALPEIKIPAKKDATLREFISKMDEHAPIIPDAVTNYYLTLAGLPPPPQTPLPLARLLALATQKFIADVAADAYQYSRIRASNSSAHALTGMPGGPAGVGVPVPTIGGGTGGEKPGVDKDKSKRDANLGVQRAGFGSGSGGGGSGRTVLTMEDLGMAVGEYGVTVRRGEWYR